MLLAITSVPASSMGKLPLSVAALIAALVVTINRLVWRRMYRLAAERYTLEA